MSTPILQAGATVTHPRFRLEKLPEHAVVIELLGNGSAELDNGLFLPVDTLTLVNTGEEWLYVAGYDGRYRVSSHGKVVSTRYRSAVRERLMSVQRPLVYPLVSLQDGPRAERIGINRLVAQHFLPPPDEARKTYLLPRDGNNLNLRADNLEWVDPAETKDEAVATRLRRSGQDHYRNKLSDEGVARAQQITPRQGRRRKESADEPTLTQLAAALGVSRQALARRR